MNIYRVAHMSYSYLYAMLSHTVVWFSGIVPTCR